MKIDKKYQDKYMTNLGRVIDDANYYLSGVSEVGQSDEFRQAFLDAIKLVKLENAKEKASEGTEELLNLIHYASKKSALQHLKCVEFVDCMLVHDLKSYDKVQELLSEN